MKFSKYNMFLEMEWGLLIYNSRLTSCVQIYNELELDKLRKMIDTDIFDENDEMVKALYEKGYLVDDDVDEYEVVKKEIEDYYEKKSRNLNIMLYVTENCNFRCVYCFEQHLNKKFSVEKWDALYKYIEKSLANDKYDKVGMSFFGGEPLLELKSILKFLDRLAILKQKYPKIKFHHEMVTNGYFLTPKVYDELVSKDVLGYMITVDGFAEAHDKTRPLVGGGKTWNKIIENLKYINSKKDGVVIKFRVNMNKHCIGTMNEFLDWYYKTFDKNKFILNLETAGEFSGLPVNQEHTIEFRDESVQAVYGKLLNDTKELMYLKRNVYNCPRIPEGHFGISVEGNITKCEDAHTNKCPTVGILSSDGEFVFNEDYKVWTTGFETEECKECVIYPLCGGRRCPDMRINSSKSAHRHKVNKNYRGDCLGNSVFEMMKKSLLANFSNIKKEI